MAETLWQQRIRRAEHLASEHPFASQILAFYIQVARFQQELYQRIQRASAGKRPAASVGVSPAVVQGEGQGKEQATRPLSGQQDVGAINPGPPELPQLLASFPPFLALVEKQAPARLAQIARELGRAPSDSWPEVLNNFWSGPDQLSEQGPEPSEFLALAFLQPYAEFVRARVPLQLQNYTYALCPFCSRKPVMGVLRPLGEGARRNLLCGFCLCEWEFRRIVCPGCDEKDHAKLPVYTAEEFPYIRVECCDACHTYIKSIDLSKNGLADPLVDELASVPLDLWAQEHGYAKLHPNLLGM
ncbi:MAG: formate dehydrogenase accessory protein FdhE [Candidatus Sulfotelmatobacter sp.]